jgi:hypothetical protein
MGLPIFWVYIFLQTFRPAGTKELFGLTLVNRSLSLISEIMPETGRPLRLTLIQEKRPIPTSKFLIPNSYFLFKA